MNSQIVLNAMVGMLTIAAAAYPFITGPKSHEQAATKSSVNIQSRNVSTTKKPLVTADTVKANPRNVQLPNFAAIHDVKEKKKAFFSFMRPYVEEVNQEIIEQRQFVKNYDVKTANKDAKLRFNKLAKKYRIKDAATTEEIKARLLRRVDIIPLELVLMQAANESGWGTSRFAVVANNLFGQWCFRKGCGVIPKGRPEGKKYEVRKFSTPADSIRSYFHNLNTGHAYKELRELRQTNRQIEEDLDPYLIAEGLLPYSTRREAYVEEIQNMLRINEKYIQ